MRWGRSRFGALVVAFVLLGSSAPAAAAHGTEVPPVDPTVDPVVDEVERCVDVIVDSAQDGALVDRVTGELCNRPPVADAGPDAPALVGTASSLDGSASSDADGDPLTYEWTLTGPDGSTASLDDPTSATPGFVPDRHGTYVARLTVHDGRSPSAEDEVRITTVNRAPVANAGPDLSVRADDPTVLDGTASSDADGDPLTYAWALLDAPAGSTAAITGADGATAALVPDVLGDYTVELTVDDGDLAATDTAVVTATYAVLLSLTPAVLHAPTFSAGSLRLDIDRPAPAGGRVVTLTSDRPDVASVPAEATIAAGETAVVVPVTTGAVAGAATITATSDRAATGQAVVDVALRTLAISLEDGLVGIGRTIDGVVTIGLPAPAGGTVVSLSSSDPARVSIAPDEVTVPEGGTSAPFTITGVSEGAVVLRATAPGHADAEATTAGTDAVVSIGGVAPMSPGESRSLPISLTRPAPPGGVTIALSSSDPSIASVPESVTVPEGQSLPDGNPQVTGHRVGTVTLTARTQGYAPDDRPVTVHVILTLTPSPKRVIAGRTSPMTLGMSGPAPAGGTTVALVAADPSKATVPATVLVPQGQTTVSFPVSGVAVGATSVTASTEGAADVTATVYVDPTPPINAQNVGVGINLQIPTSVGLTAPPDGPSTITVTVADESKAVVSASRTATGAKSVTFTNVTGTAPYTVYVQGLALGSTSYTVSSPGSATATRTLEVTRAGVAFFGVGSSFTTTTFSPNWPLDLRTIRLNASNQYAGEQEPRPGFPVSVEVTSSNTTVGTITTSPVVFAANVPAGGNGWHRNTQFNPANAGTTTVALTQPPGFTPVANLPASLAVTVTAPAISAPPVGVGAGLQVPITVALSQPPPSPVDLTITVNGPTKAVVSASRSAEGTPSITFAGVSSSGPLNRTAYFQGLALGTTSYTVSAPGFQTSTHTLEVTRAGVAFFGVGSSFTTTTFSPNWPLDLRTIRLNASNQYAGEQEPRPGFPVSVEVTSSNTTVGTITTSPVVFAANVPAGGNGWHRNTQFNPANAGTTTIALTQPPGFTAPVNVPTALTATVTAPPIYAPPVGVGTGLQVPITIALSQPPPSPVDLTITVTDPTKAVVSASRTTEGDGSITFAGVSSSGPLNRTVYFQGLALGTTTYTVSAPGFQTSTHTLEVTRAGVAFFGVGPSFTTTTFSPNWPLDLRTIRLNASNQYAGEQEPRPGFPVSVEVTSDNVSVGTITTSPVIFAANVPAGGNGWHRNTQFNPATAGSARLSIAQPTGFTAPANVPSAITANVRPPTISLDSTSVGRDLQTPVSVRLEAAPPEPVDVTVTISSAALGALSRNRTTTGGASVTFTNVTTTSVGTFYLQGLELGTTTVLAQAAGYADASQVVAVTNAGVAMFGGPFTVGAGEANRNVDVRVVRLNASNQYAGEQEPRPGITVSVSVTSSDPAVGTITNSPLPFSTATGWGGTGWLRFAEFDPQAPGTATVSVTQPDGFVTPANVATSITVTVT